MEHLESNLILSDNQHGFRSTRSCETQLVNTIEAIAREIDHRGQMDMLILDFSKAFDTVPHQRLLYKMSHYGITSNTLQWVSAWLTTRQQRVCVDGESSRNNPVRSGVHRERFWDHYAFSFTSTTWEIQYPEKQHYDFLQTTRYYIDPSKPSMIEKNYKKTSQH